MKHVLLITALFLLNGCFSSTPNSRFYLLESLETQVFSQNKFSIAVQNISIPAYLEKPQIVLQNKNSPELKISEFNRWASDLNTMLKNVLIENLQKEFPNALVKPLSYGTTSKYVVKINIEKLSGWLNKDASLVGNYQILSSTGRLLGESDFDLSTSAGKTYADYVSAQSLLLRQLSEKISQSILEKMHQI